MNKAFKAKLPLRSFVASKWKGAVIGHCDNLVISHGGITGSVTLTKTPSTDFYNKQSDDWESNDA